MKCSHNKDQHLCSLFLPLDTLSVIWYAVSSYTIQWDWVAQVSVCHLHIEMSLENLGNHVWKRYKWT